MKKETFTFDVLGPSPNKIRENLNVMGKSDKAVAKAKEISDLLKDPKNKGKAVAFIKVAVKHKHMPFPKRFLFALFMYKRADKLENQRKSITGDSNKTIAMDYQTFVKGIDKNVNVVLGRELRESNVVIGRVRSYRRDVYKTRYKQGRKYFSTRKPSERKANSWQFDKKHKNSRTFLPAWRKKTGASLREAQDVYSDITFLKYIYSYANYLSKKKNRKYAVQWALREMRKYGVTNRGVINNVSKNLNKTIKKHEKKRFSTKIKKIAKIAKKVARVAVSVAKIIPGVSDAVKTAENAVKQIPEVKQAITLANKVKNTVKDAKSVGDIAKIEKLKKLGLNQNVMNALDISKVVQKKIENTVNKVKLLDTASLLDTAKLIAPDKIDAAMKLVKSAQEMNPEAILKIKNIQKLADSGLMEAQDALHSIKTAMAIRTQAKEQVQSKYLMWQYW